jgi:hypothetical protein
MTKVFIAKSDRNTRSSSNFVVLSCVVLLSVAFVIFAATTVILPLYRGSESKHATTRSTPVDDGIERVPYALLMANVDRQIAERRAWLSTLHSEGAKFSELKGAAMWYMFQPVMPCLWYMEKVPNVIILHDGGVRKYICHMRLPVDLFSATNFVYSTRLLTLVISGLPYRNGYAVSTTLPLRALETETTTEWASSIPSLALSTLWAPTMSFRLKRECGRSHRAARSTRLTQQ